MSKFKELTRPILSYVFAVGITVGFFMGKVPPEVYAPIATACIIFWFRARDEEKGK